MLLSPLLSRFAFSFCLALSVAISAQDSPPAKEDATPAPKPAQEPRKPAQVMGVGGAIWLERPDRILTEKPEVVIGAMELKETDVVADLGCGSGFFTKRIAPLVPKGKVLAVDIQPGMIDIVKKVIEEEKLTNVEPILSDETDPKLPKGGVDWILLVDVYHEFQDPAPMLAKMLESLSPTGKVMLVEYRLLGESAKHIKLEHRMSPKQVLSEWNPAGFELVDIIEDLPSQHMFIFQRRSELPTPAAASAK